MSDESMLPPPELVESALKFCRCCDQCAVDQPPCHGALITGICDQQRCTCDDERDDDYDDEDRP